MALKASKVAIEKAEIVANCIDLIIVATTSTNVLMPGISYYIQKELKIENMHVFRYFSRVCWIY